MSHSSGNRRSGGKGFSGSKKPRKVKQSFHEHRLKGQESAPLDLEIVRESVITSLNKLGSQVFSSETSGYGLDSWAKNFNALLDDFEDRVGGNSFPSDYAKVRAEASVILSKPVDTSAVDTNIQELKREEGEHLKRIEDEKARLREKLETLLREQARVSDEIAGQRKQSAEPEKFSPPQPFFKRLLGRDQSTGPEPAETDIKELEARLASLKKEVAETDKLRRFAGEREVSDDSPYKGERGALESIRAELSKLDKDRSDILGRTRERGQVTSAMVQVISRVNLMESHAQEGIAEN